MTPQDKPEALRLADLLEQQFPEGTAQAFLDGEAAAELRRLHEENAQLARAAAEALRAKSMLQKQDEALMRQALTALKDIRSLSSRNLAIGPNPYELTAVLAEIHYIASAVLAKEKDNEQ